MAHPFKLGEKDAHALSRYLIEDCEDEYLYCDLTNENNRQIVKSILKAFIGEYQLPTTSLLDEQEALMKKYRPNL